MKVVKRIAIALVVYVGIVIAFESLIGYFQPAGQGTLVITTTAADGAVSDRVLGHLESGGQLYVAANHWPGAWYRRALDQPNVQVTLNLVGRTRRDEPRFELLAVVGQHAPQPPARRPVARQHDLDEEGCHQCRRDLADGATGDYRAVPVTGGEHDRVNADHGLGVVFRILTGFPPRYFVRLDPR